MILIEPHPTLPQLKTNAMQSHEQMEAELGKAGHGSGGSQDGGGKESVGHLYLVKERPSHKG